MSFRSLVLEAPPAAPPLQDTRHWNDPEVLELASARLGYRPPEAGPSARSYELARALLRIGCRAFTADSVARYKDGVVREAARRAAPLARQIKILAMSEHLAPDVMVYLASGVVTGFLGGLLVSLWLPEAGVQSLAILVGLASGLLISLACYWRAGALHRLSPEVRSARIAALAAEAATVQLLAWAAETPLRDYRLAAVPDRVLALACNVVDACPNSEVVVHHTVVDHLLGAGVVPEGLRPKRTNQLLEVRLGEESYFVAAWDDRDSRVAGTTVWAD